MVVPFAHVVLMGLSGAGARFWAEALAGTWRAAGPDPDLPASLVPEGGDAYVHRPGRGADAPDVVLEVDDVAAETERFVGLGARRDGVRLRSPGGLAFALEPVQGRTRPPAARRPDGTTSRLVQLCLDCPPGTAEREAEFWAAATGWGWQDCDGPEFVCHLVPPGPGTGSLQLLVQRRDSDDPAEVTLHLDLGCSDREAEAARLVALGATRIATGDGWIVLEDPDGRRFCATGQPPEAP
jgi:hypothetical protein